MAADASMATDAGAEVRADVVVVGYGGAGAVAAIAAHDAGADVVVVEKRAIGGGSTRLSSGGILIPQGPRFADYLDAIWLGRTPRAVIERFVAEAIGIEAYCASIGVALSGWPGNSQEVSSSYPQLGRPSWPNVAGGEMIRLHAAAREERPVSPQAWAAMTNNERVRHIGRTYGIDLWEQLDAAVRSRGIPVRYETPARRLTSDGGEITGVVAEHHGREVTYAAQRAVVMTTGGFGSNAEMQRTFLSCPFVYAGTGDYATGDGHAMAQTVGARFWHMQTVCGQLGFKAPEIDQAFQPRAVGESFMWVDRRGRRYTNETAEKVHNAWRNAALFDPGGDLRDGDPWPRIPVYMVFDETMRARAPISRDWRSDYQWSLDNGREIERGWITAGETVAALADALGIDADALQETIASFNAACRDGADHEFGRDPATMAPIEHGPYYALALVPMLISTHGGPEHDEESRVLALDGRPIPRLYAAGELSSICGWLYEAGSGHAECIVFGRIAGANAAAETPRASS